MINIIIIFAILGGIDKLLNNRFGLGEKFDEGFRSMGGLALTIVGIYSITPILVNIINPVLYPLADFLRVDSSVFISSILATDLGGYSTSITMAKNALVGEFNGIILSSTLGTVISFTIPVAVGMVKESDYGYFFKGVLAGIMTVPLGMLAGGLLMGLTLAEMFSSLLVVIVFSIIIIVGLMKSQEKIIKIFTAVGKIIITVSTGGLIVTIITYMFKIDIIDGIIPLEEGIMLVASICIILSGAYPMFYVISRTFNKYLLKIGYKLGLDQYSILGLFSSLANCIPMLGIYDNMNDKGKVLNAAFAVSGAFTFGGQLGYISSISNSYTNPFIIAKLVSGFSAIIVAMTLIKLEEKRSD